MLEKRITPSYRIKAELQKEIGSRCPFCPSENVGHFEIHHIDQNKNNTIPENLLMLCRECHSKFTKGEWEAEVAAKMKEKLLFDVDWKLYQSRANAFDFLCYDMQNENGRLPKNHDNGSRMQVLVKDRYHFSLTLRQSDNRIWNGELVLKQRDFGLILFHYQGMNEFEYGKKECHLKQIFGHGFREDLIFLKPLPDLKDYGNELIKRRTPTT